MKPEVESNPLPTIALTIPRPWTWLIAQGARRDWLVGTDPSGLVGRNIALHSGASGDASGWRRLDVWSRSPVTRQAVAGECPHLAIVGVARVESVAPRGACWQVRLVEAQPLAPVGRIASGELELWPIPRRWREELERALRTPLAARSAVPMTQGVSP
jgi:hypothetical protein